MVRVVAFAVLAVATAWKPESCDTLEDGVPCRKLYEHPQGSTFVGTCPKESWANVDGCSAYLAGKPAEAQCPQIECPKALGVTMKLVCSGSCCPTCWAPDHIVAVDRHTSLDEANTVPPNPAAPKHCQGVKCFPLVCAPGEQEGFVEGTCCTSCMAR